MAHRSRSWPWRWGYPVLQPERVRRAAFREQATALRPDALVVVSFGQIIPQSLLDLPRWGGINVHASLLPRWRGAAPIHRAIIAGDEQTGVATMQMEATLDTGPVYLVNELTIAPDDTVGTLETRLAARGGPLLVQTLDALEAGTLVGTPQNDAGMTYAAPVERADGLLDPATMTARQMDRIVRAMSPRPGAFLDLAGRPVKVLAVRVEETATDAIDAALSAGSLAAVDRDGVVLVGAEGTRLRLLRLQPENRGPMDAAAWARGARVGLGEQTVFARGGSDA